MSDHDCVRRVNLLMDGQNTVISQAISVGNSSRELIIVATSKKDPRRRGKPAVMFASHCPFCGRKLDILGSAS